ncbi:DEAD-domain-containing protein [Serendipita vermifera]|nr:DEAD-domain-containing protein [Serendipita vermifera]
MLQDEDMDDQEEMEMIQQSIAKRNMREGTELLKKTSNIKGKGKAKNEVGGGSFQSMGLHPSLLRALTLRGYRTPTPIQRASIPLLLATPPRDLVGMARTGSGKTLAYMIPLLQRLGGRHSPIVGARALILVPSRELAVQVLRVGRELGRGWREEGNPEHAGEKQDTSHSAGSSALRWALVVGGEGLDEQFETMATNPDVIIATPGRLLHLLMEMSLSLSTIQYLVFDEADRLFEMGFSSHLTTILEKLPTTRQTLLFSATLPKSLVEFAKAGLQEPKLVRLDSEMKISSDLRMSFWSVKEGEKDAALLCLLKDVIGVPLAETQRSKHLSEGESKNKKAKGTTGTGAIILKPHQTLVFVSTQHHVAYVSSLLKLVGYSVSSIHGTLTQAARTSSLAQFVNNHTSILVTTDVAARGIDIPVLENVVNYDFPVGNRVFVHRVGRTARMGRKGWAWSFVGRDELPYLLDLHLFLGRPLINELSNPGSEHEGRLGEDTFVDSLILGPFPRDAIDQELEYIKNIYETNYDLVSLKGVMERGTKMYNRTKGKASPISYSRSKDMLSDARWGFTYEGKVNPAWAFRVTSNSTLEQSRSSIQSQPSSSSYQAVQVTRESLLQSLSRFRPSETVFEIGSRGKTAGAQLMKDRRRALEKANKRTTVQLAVQDDEDSEGDDDEESERPTPNSAQSLQMADEDDLAAVFGKSRPSTEVSKQKKSKSKSENFKDEDFYLAYTQKDAETEKGYSLRDGATFTEQAAHVTFDLTNDTGGADARRRQSQLKWDRKKKKFVKGDGIGADNVKLIKTESGTKLPISYKSGRYDEWIKGKGRGKEIRVGEHEREGSNRQNNASGKRWKHTKVADAKPLDKLAKDYERKMRIMNKKGSKLQGDESNDNEPPKKSSKPGARGLGKRWKGKSTGQVRNELKNVQQIRKQRNLLEKRRAKNARGPRKGKGRH